MPKRRESRRMCSVVSCRSPLRMRDTISSAIIPSSPACFSIPHVFALRDDMADVELLAGKNISAISLN